PSIDSFPSPGGIHIHTLNPPKGAVTPIAPFIGDHELSEQWVIIGLFQFGDHEKSPLGSFDQGDGSEKEAVEIEAAAFRFLGHCCTERCDRLDIFWPGTSNLQVIEDWHVS